MTVEQILDEAMQMPTPVRAFVAETLLESLDYEESVELSDEWMAEIRSRITAMDEGHAEMIAAEQVFSLIHKKLRP